MIYDIKNEFSKCYSTLVQHIPVLEDALLSWRASFILKKYRSRREHYENVCKEQSLVYSEHSTIEAVRKCLKGRGWTVRRKNLGGVHTFAFVPRVSWHSALLDELYFLGRVSEFDYASQGYVVKDLYQAKNSTLLEEMNKKAFNNIIEVHRNDPIDWIFIYASGAEISPNLLLRIKNETGIPCVIMCLDDKQSWEFGMPLNTHRKGQIDLAKHIDLAWTSSRVACSWYLAEGGRPIYLPEGVNTNIYCPKNVGQDISVSFVGQSYGFRESVVRFLKKGKVKVQCFGNGWQSRAVSTEKIVDIYRRSRIILGMGGVGWSEYLTNVKGRDFEVPCTGGGMYLTSFNPDLALHFDVGREIVCYRSRDEMLELIRYYISHQEEAREIAKAGRVRCLNEHRWLHRYIKICKILGIFEDSVSFLKYSENRD